MLQQLDGVEEARIDGFEDRATVIYDPSQVTVDEMVAAVQELGFVASEGGP